MIKDDLQKILGLQTIDAQIYQIHREQEEMPERLKKLDEELNHLKSGVTHCEENVKKLQLTRKDKELDLQTKETNVKKFQLQLYQVKSNKEYGSLEKEIQGLKADNSLLEEEIIRLLDEIDSASAELTQKKKEFDQRSQEISNIKKEIEQKLNSLKEELSELKNQRKTITQQIFQGILQKYERILKSRNGLAIVPVRQNACQGCFMNLPPQVINEIQAGENWTTCEQCARILYLEQLEQ